MKNGPAGVYKDSWINRYKGAEHFRVACVCLCTHINWPSLNHTHKHTHTPSNFHIHTKMTTPFIQWSNIVWYVSHVLVSLFSRQQDFTLNFKVSYSRRIQILNCCLITFGKPRQSLWLKGLRVNLKSVCIFFGFDYISFDRTAFKKANLSDQKSIFSLK